MTHWLLEDHEAYLELEYLVLVCQEPDDQELRHHLLKDHERIPVDLDVQQTLLVLRV